MAKRLSGPRRAELCARFVAIVRKTGNARAAARALGHPDLFAHRIKRDPAFRAEVAAARAEGEAKLAGAASPFLAPARRRPKLPIDAEALGGSRRERA